MNDLSPGTARMELRTTLTSPFGRKVRIAAIVLGLDGRIDVRPADTLDPDDDLRVQNPLGKMPCLTVGDTILYDSRVILDYLDALAGGGRLLPAAGLARYRALTRAALADGIADASLLMVYDGRFRADVSGSSRWLAHQEGKVRRGLRAFERDPPAPRDTLVGLSLASALGYLDWRRPLDWRPDFPGLVAWLAAYADSEPAFARTERPR